MLAGATLQPRHGARMAPYPTGSRGPTLHPDSAVAAWATLQIWSNAAAMLQSNAAPLPGPLIFVTSPAVVVGSEGKVG